MERVAFLIEKSNQRLGCLLNPESLVLRRAAGVQPRRLATGQVTGAGLSDDPLLYTGGGRTELELDLLFDTSLAGSSVATEDVRDLTAPLWRLSENANADANADSYGTPPIVRFIWGKSWNIPGVIVAVAERLEHFTPSGVPQRSWLRLRMVRTDDPTAARTRPQRPLPVLLPSESLPPAGSALTVHERLGGGGGAAALMPELSIGDALFTSGDLISAAIAETPAANWLFAACQQIIASVDESLTQVGAWIADAGDNSTLRAIRTKLEAMGAATRAVLIEAKTRLVATATAASARVAASAQAIGGHVRTFTAPATQFMAELLEGAMANIRPLARSMAQSAAIIATAVRAKAARVIAATMPYIESGRVRVMAALNQAGVFVSATGTKAADAIRSVMKEVSDGLTQMRQSGQPSRLAGVATALGRVGGAIDALWSSGKRRTARLISAALPKIALVIKNALEAGEALVAVSGRTTRRMISSATDGLRSALAAHRADDPQSTQLLQEATVELASSIEAGASTATPAQWQAVEQPLALVQETVEAAVIQVESTPSPQVSQQMEVALDAVTTSVAQIDETEETETAGMVQETIRATTRPTPVMPESGPESAPEGVAEGGTERDTMARDEAAAEANQPARLDHERARPVDFGERLDQLAYQYYGDAAYWRILATLNAIEDPLRLATGLLLRIAPPSALRGPSTNPREAST